MSLAVVEFDGLNDICRLCAIESESGVSIYGPEGETINLEQKIISCLRIEVSRNDYLPKKVCCTCNTMLEEFHQFSCRAANAQQTLSFLFDLHLRQFQENDLSLIHNVKLEGNLIKNELDELTVHQGELQIAEVDNISDDSTTINFSSIQSLPDDSVSIQSLTEFQSDPLEKPKNDIPIVNTVTVPNGNGTKKESSLCDESRTGHRRKMSTPKKAADKILVNEMKGKNDTLEADIITLHAIELGSEQVLAQIQPHVDAVTTVTPSQIKNFDHDRIFQDFNCEEVIEQKSISEQGTTPGNNTTRDWAIACSTCRRVFALRADFEAHCRDAHSEKPNYTCSQCAKSFSNFLSYRSHFYRHQSKYSCSYCDKVFTLEGMLRVHVLSRHVTVRPFVCDKCGKGYVTQYRLDIHRKQHEEDQKEFRCNQCDKVLQTRNGLSAHMTVHRFGRRFQCHLCGKTFTQKVNMQQHVKYHKGERPYPCDQCNKRFAEKSHLKRHKSFHTVERPFQCSVCLKMYKTERCLKVHSQVHEGTRRFICSECGKGFLNVTKLKQHFHCHTGERPYACKYCERTFTNYPNWLKHTRRRHKVDHKTGVKLKEENSSFAVPQVTQENDIQAIDLLCMADVKEDTLLGGDGTQSILTQFHVTADTSDLTQFL